MADSKLSALTSLPGVVDPADEVYIVSGGSSYKTTIGALVTGLANWDGRPLGSFQAVVDDLGAGPIANDFTGKVFIEVDTGSIQVDACDVGTSVTIIQMGTVELEFVPDAGQTILNVDGHTKTGGQYAAVSLICVDVDTWVLSGRTQS